MPRAPARRPALGRIPLLAIFAGIAALAMLLPALHAVLRDDEDTARPFLYAAILILLGCVLVSLARGGEPDRRAAARAELVALVGTFTALPFLLAVPLAEAEGLPLGDAAFEMVSALTTTGATLYDPSALSGPAHLWRATVGWLGGLFMWVAAAAILAPMNLGGFEIAADGPIGAGAARRRGSGGAGDRMRRYARQLLPAYAGLTAALWVALLVAGETPLRALITSMSTLSTSGIVAGGLGATGTSGVLGEVLVLMFLVFALSRATFADESRSAAVSRMHGDPELRLGLVLLASAAAFLFLRHFVGAADLGVTETEDIPTALGAAWGSLFTAASFLTTTGFVSDGWSDAALWSGLETPGVVLMALALVGGGVATTAGGVKLFRIYALGKHAERELERLVLPSSIAGAGMVARRIRRTGARAAWVFFMLFALSLAGTCLALAATGVPLEDALILTAAALSNCGPVAQVAGDGPIDLAALTPFAKTVMAAAMVLGRLETLAIVALLNPSLWRN
ncbi:trk system potassium uptake protein TrkH [Hasllibacter halocynthiae]|uniref:Trk system potassium uptake protein TrkH n=1 Tax=Hasllibacter halocynthiae TaxID=595589 RepID=A0A2T0X8D4_9RHOB|nr:potassium transporter TrkG [Hasllibacter halocynthiae]PRY95165.1 trk system potassium uptake protein TrkH [Hasllibacter halocynthiae]